MKAFKRLLSITLLIVLAAWVQATSTTRVQTPRFNVRFSKPLAVYSFVFNLSSMWGPLTLGGANSFKALFQGSPYDNAKYRALIDEFIQTKTAYDFGYPDYSGVDKAGLSTQSLLWKEMGNSQNIEEFKQRAVGIIPNEKLFTLAKVLSEFEPVYEDLVYKSNKQAFETQLRALEELIGKTDMGRYLDVGIKFYGASWDASVPINLYFYPLSRDRGFTATVFYNNGISGIPTSLTDFNGLLSVMFHEMFHTLFDEQPITLKQEIAEWRKSNASKATHYAFSLLNEALATALANGYVSSQLSGKLNEGNWYGRKYVSAMAKKIYPLVAQYVESGKPMDKNFIDAYVRLFEDNYSEWLRDLDFVMEYRSAVSDRNADFDAIDKKFPYNQTADYKTPFKESILREIAESATTKIVFITSEHQRRLDLLKTVFPELRSWKPDTRKDFTHTHMLNDKSYLVVINVVKSSAESLIGTLDLNQISGLP